MSVCVCACVCTCEGARVCARARARASKRTCVHVLHKLAPRRVLLPPLFLLHHPLSSSPLLFSLADPPPRRTVFNDVASIIRDTGPRRQPWPSQVRASAERSAACAAGDLPERSLDGGKAGAEGSLYAAKGFLARGRQEGRAAAARKPLEPVLREFFYARPWFSSRGTCRREFSSRTIHLR